MRLEGILAPVTTPFDAAGELDVAAFARNVRAHLEAGLDGVVVAGSTGEAALLDEAERLRLVEAARREVPTEGTLIVGTGGESTRAVIARNRAVAERGADAVLVVGPHYYGDAMTPDAMVEHYTRIADASPIPVLLYTIPKYMHFALAEETVLALSRHDNVVGMKDSSGDAALLAGYLKAKSPGFRVLTGSGTLLAQALGMGADGAILAVALFAPALSREVVRAARSRDVAAVTAAQAQLAPLAARIVAGMGVPGVKAALDAVGLVGGAPRPPLRALSAPLRETLRGLLAELRLAAEPATTR